MYIFNKYIHVTYYGILQLNFLISKINFTDRISMGGNAIVTICPSVSTLSFEPTDLCMGHSHSAPGIEGQGQRSTLTQPQP